MLTENEANKEYSSQYLGRSYITLPPQGSFKIVAKLQLLQSISISFNVEGKIAMQEPFPCLFVRSLSPQCTVYVFDMADRVCGDGIQLHQRIDAIVSSCQMNIVQRLTGHLLFVEPLHAVRYDQSFVLFRSIWTVTYDMISFPKQQNHSKLGSKPMKTSVFG